MVRTLSQRTVLIRRFANGRFIGSEQNLSSGVPVPVHVPCVSAATVRGSPHAVFLSETPCLCMSLSAWPLLVRSTAPLGRRHTWKEKASRSYMTYPLSESTYVADHMAVPVSIQVPIHDSFRQLEGVRLLQRSLAPISKRRLIFPHSALGH